MQTQTSGYKFIRIQQEHRPWLNHTIVLSSLLIKLVLSALLLETRVSMTTFTAATQINCQTSKHLTLLQISHLVWLTSSATSRDPLTATAFVTKVSFSTSSRSITVPPQAIASMDSSLFSRTSLWLSVFSFWFHLPSHSWLISHHTASAARAASTKMSRTHGRQTLNEWIRYD